MKSFLFCLGILLSINNYSQVNRYTNLSTSTYRGSSYEDYAYLARIKRERMCQNFINDVKKNAEHKSTYSYQSTAIYDVKFYEGTLEDDTEVYFSIVRFKNQYGGASKEYIYQVNEFTEKNYASNYRYSAGKAFYNYIYKYNSMDLCSSNKSLSTSALEDPINTYSSSNYKSSSNNQVTYTSKQKNYSEELYGRILVNEWEYQGSYLYIRETLSFAPIYSDKALTKKMYDVDNGDYVLVIKRESKNVRKIWYKGAFGYMAVGMLKF